MDALRATGATVDWKPFVQSRGWGLGYAPAGGEPGARAPRRGRKRAVDSPDVVVAHLTPEYYPPVRERYPRTPLVGHTVWETDVLPRHWPELLDQLDLLVVPCEWNAEVVKRAGVSTPIRVVPHAADLEPVPPEIGFPNVAAETFVFYTISTWITRKAIWNTVEAYLRAFSESDPVLLIIKTDPIDHTVIEPDPSRPHAGTTPWALARLLSRATAPPPIQLVTRTLSEGEISSLHTRGDCLVSLCRSEGWGLTSCDAASRGVPVVITGFGGHLDYLDHDNALLVDHELVPVDDPAGEGSYTPDQRWAEPSIEHAAELLRSVFENPAAARERGAVARQQIASRYSPERVGRLLLDGLKLTVDA
jgi:glycosyltransferase involved in cell wall biosynthesis